MLRIPFMNDEHADMACKTLSVDRELNPEVTSKSFCTEGANLVITVSSVDDRRLRTAVSAIFDMLLVVDRTLQAFPVRVSR